MKNLDECRVELNSIDDKMKELFILRMKTIKDVALYKKENGLAIFDEKREALMKNRLSSDVNEVKDEYLEFLDCILKVSKDYQNKIIG